MTKHRPAVAALLAGLVAISAGAQTPPDFHGRALVLIRDGDMAASAYVDRRLGPPAAPDALMVVPLGVTATVPPTSVPVTNSVVGPPSSVATTPDGRFAFVVETLGPRPVNAENFDALPPGTALTVIDLSVLTAPRVVERIEVGKRPTSVAVSPDGRMLAVTLHPLDGRQLLLIPFENGVLGRPVAVGLPGIPKDLESPHVDWHPSGRFLAVTILGRNEIAFFAVDRGQSLPSIAPWGQPVQVGKYPMMGRFTPDGRFFVNVNLYWGRDVDGFFVGAPRGDVTVTRFASSGAEPRHSVIARADAGVSPEGISISPDGRFVITANLERSYLPHSDSRVTRYASLTLFSLDTDTGALVGRGETLFDGVLPESAVFDATSRSVAAVVFSDFPERTPDGALAFWRIVDDVTSGGPRLVKENAAWPLPRGPHSMTLIR